MHLKKIILQYVLTIQFSSLIIVNSNLLNNIHKVQYTKFSDALFINIYIGTPPQKIPVKLDLNGKFPFISCNDYIGSKSVSYSGNRFHRLEINETSYLVEGIDDMASITNNYEVNFVHFHFYLLGTFIDRNTTSFPLYYKVNYSRNSLIHSYKSNDIIKQFKFYLEPTNDNEGFLHFGEDPDIIYSLQNVNKYISKCHVNTTDNYWGCFLNKISIGNYNFKVNNYTIFKTSHDSIIVPEKCLDFLAEKIFNKAIKDEICTYYSNTIYKKKYIFCKNTNFPMDNIYFYFEGYGYLLEIQKLFSCDKERCIFLIKYEKNEYDYSIGLPFLSNYISEFNFENNSITFYSNTSIIIEEDTFVFEKILLMISIGLLVIFSLHNCFAIWIISKR